MIPFVASACIPSVCCIYDEIIRSIFQHTIESSPIGWHSVGSIEYLGCAIETIFNASFLLLCHCSTQSLERCERASVDKKSFSGRNIRIHFCRKIRWFFTSVCPIHWIHCSMHGALIDAIHLCNVQYDVSPRIASKYSTHNISKSKQLECSNH